MGVSDDLVSAGRSAVDLVRVAVDALAAQGGGGKSGLAQGEGSDAAGASGALDVIRAALG